METPTFSNGSIPTSDQLTERVEKLVKEKEADLTERQEIHDRKLQEAVRQRKSLEKEIEDIRENPGAGAKSLAQAAERFAEACREEVKAVHDLQVINTSWKTIFHKVRTEVYREAIGGMREKAKAARQLPELKRKARNADKALEDLERILRRVDKGDFLFKSGPLDVFGSDLIEIKERLED